MPSARITNIASGVTLRAQSTSGVWRDLAENDVIEHGEEILAQSDYARWGDVVYNLQRRSAAAWIDAQSVTLSVPAGNSTYRQDRWSITGDDNDSTCTLLVTVDAGELLLRDMLNALKAMEKTRLLHKGVRYACVVDNSTFSTDLGEGGWDVQGAGAVILDREQFSGGAAPFIDGDKVTVNGRTLKIRGIDTDEISVALRVQQTSK